MEKQGKVWGETSTIYKGNNVEVHYITVQKDGFCSKHTHAHKFNKFTVIKGTLLIRIWKDYGSQQLVDETILNAGDEITVSPGEFHQFEALTDVEAIETYWVTLSSNDIEREVQGGIKKV